VPGGAQCAVESSSVAALLVREVDGQYRAAHADEVLQHARQVLARQARRGMTVYPREVVKEALALNAAALAMAHNHPSGVAEPSRADEFLPSLGRCQRNRQQASKSAGDPALLGPDAQLAVQKRWRSPRDKPV
jgi:hypothetical protein